MALSLELNTFEEKLDRFQLAQPEERVAIVDVHHTRRLPYWLGGGLSVLQGDKERCAISQSTEIEVHGFR